MCTLAQLPRATCALTHVRLENKYRTYFTFSSRKRVAVKEIMTAAVAISNRRPRRAARENCQPGRGGLTPTKRLAVRGAGDRCAAAGRWARLWRAARSGRRRKRRGRRRGRGTLHRRYRCPNHRQGGLVPDAFRFVLSGARPGRASSRPRHLRRVRQGRDGARKLRGGAAIWRSWRGGR